MLMKVEYEIPKRAVQFLCRLITEYTDSDFAHIGKVLAGSRYFIQQTEEKNWYGQYGHVLVLLVPDHLMGNIPVNEQQDIEVRLAEDLNKAAHFIDDEFISEVRFEHLEGHKNGSKSFVISDEINELTDNEQVAAPNTIEVFISHRDTDKKYVHQLASELKERYGLSSFVAHDTIEPDEDWQNEIVNALNKMDIMVTFISDNFFKSVWTNQEIGFAFARDIPIISVKVGKEDPPGFIRTRQAIIGNTYDMKSNATEVWGVVKKRLLHKPLYRDFILHRFMQAYSYEIAADSFEELVSLPDLTDEEIELLVEAFNSNSQLYECYKLINPPNFYNWVKKASPGTYIMDKGKVIKKSILNE